jgi:hypothetical protein
MPGVIEGTNVAVEFRPTLIVGLGGTGHEVLVRLKSRLLDTFGEHVFDIVKLLTFDTADEPLQVSNARGALVSLEKGTELINIGGVPVPAIVANLERQPAIKNWLPKDIPVRALQLGAAQVRALGRLALFYHYAQIRSVLQSRILELKNIRLQGPLSMPGLAAAETEGINAFVVCSLSGGTGSGTFIDISYLIRHLCAYNGIKPDMTFINAMLVLPQAFAQVPADAIRANAYAALRELDWFMSDEGSYAVEFPTREMINIRWKPFNICYLIDTVNERGSNLAGISELAPMMADSILVQIGSQVGKAGDAAFDNVKALSGKDSDHPTAYSGVGIASINFPAKRIVEVCANRLAAQIISDQLLSSHSDQEHLDSEVRGFIDASQLDRNKLLVELSRAPNGQVIVVQLQDSVVAEATPEELLGKVKQYMTQYEAQTLNTTFNMALENNRKAKTQELGAAIKSNVERLLDNPQFGLPAAIAFLEILGQHIRKMTDDLTTERQSLGDRVAASKRQAELSENELKEAVSSFALGRSGRVNKSRPAYLAVRQRGFQDQFDMSRRSQAISLLAELNVVLSEQRKRASALADRLNNVKRQFDNVVQNTTVARDRFSSPLTYDVSTQKDVDRYYQSIVEDISHNRTELEERKGSLSSWLAASQDEIAERMLDYTRQVFAPIWDIKIEDVIVEKRTETSPDERLQILRRDSSPFWNYEGPRMQDGGTNMESIKVIGVADQSESIYKGKELTGERLASTHDYHSLTVLHTRHGLPLFALQQYSDYRQKYKNHMQRKISPVQLFSHINIADDEGEREARQIFALSEAFGFVKVSGSNQYTCRTSDELSIERPLGQGLTNAVHMFVEQQDLSREMSRVIDRHINNNLGRPAALKVLEDYVRAVPNPGPSPTPREQLMIELRRLAREYRDRLLE